ncbi:uncharacterized protein LOC112463884 [Temnothorax curvispinosus]|uniref:Uncharacterized protein LOC112463884 n=1 Tax=Temnothorax curvispinosus TaxID=300111 RepID=A0A6J1QVC3_9HYME|nr:uncharacterized protein LOC112463884 [Temnothorax curvispinosus]XP_024886326.1 uncharacterized protein LOC112463884 [Temnothorax curvispinosus]XP_024886327.1 uncharacterized protein LOC112463884 [Temnothorax curvispinosus]
MTRVCICCKYRASKDVSLLDVSLFGFPKSDELLKKWSLVIGTDKKITRSSQICSRHFKEEDFRYSLVGGKRYLKKEAIPSLHLNKETKDETVSNNQGTIIKENQSTNTAVIEYNERAPENKVSNIVELHIKAVRDDKLSERLSLAPAGPSEPEKNRKKYLYDVRWEEISTSSVQAKIYWEVVIKKIMRQKLAVRLLRRQIRRLKSQILNLQTLVKKKRLHTRISNKCSEML